MSLILLFSTNIYAQTERDSTVQDIAPVRIRSYFSSQPFLKHTSSAKVITRELMEAQMPGTILPAINTTPGVRMEERSPGSYRLALRGSMLRSPFGVRNTKMYLDEIPFTDAGGNTYLSSLDPVGLQQVTIIKGPDGSLFGPNSGGVVRITPFGLDSIDPTTRVLLSGGSFGTLNQQLSHRQQVTENYQFSFDQGFMRSDGYRDHTDMNRTYLQTGHQWQYNLKGKLKFLGIYSDLYYSNPGGLTLEQFQLNPRLARPPAGPNRGAEEQGASVHNKMLLGGLVHEYRFSDKWSHSISVFGNYTDVKNPLVTNLERRYEKNVGFRTYVSYNDSLGDIVSWQMQAGMEMQHGDYQIDYFDNNYGVPGNMQSIDDMKYGQQAYFYRASATLADRLTAEASIGLNFNDIESVQRFSIRDLRQPVDIHFTPAWMPRLALSYTILRELAVRSSVSRGYSPPALSEVLSSDNILSPNLRAEGGYNYEIGLRSEVQNRRWLFDISAYQYRLNNGIVRQLNEDGTEFFVNSGTIDQRGVELLIMGQLIRRNNSQFIRGMHVSTALTFQDYTFREYSIIDGNETLDYSGNQVTSIPRWMSINSVHLQFPHQLGLNIMHNYISSIPLNDANTTYANYFHLVQAKASWKLPIQRAKNIQLFVGADNILNQTYSLGNDINAFGGRFFNAAPTRNYYGGLSVEW